MRIGRIPIRLEDHWQWLSSAGSTTTALQHERQRPTVDFRPANSGTACFRCCSDKHLANSSECPAAKVQCKSCCKRGHFAWVRCSMPSSDVHELKLPDFTILYLENSTYSPKRLLCNVSISSLQLRPCNLLWFCRVYINTTFTRHFSSTLHRLRLLPGC